MSCDRHLQSPMISSPTSDQACMLCAIEKVAKDRDDALYRIASLEEDLHSEILAKESALTELEDARSVVAQTEKLQHSLEQLSLICTEAVELLDAPVFHSTEYENTLDAMRAAGFLDD